MTDWFSLCHFLRYGNSFSTWYNPHYESIAILVTYVHRGVDLTDSFVVCRELIDLDAIAHQLTHYLDFEFVKLALGDCVRFGNNGNYVDLKTGSRQEQNYAMEHSFSYLRESKCFYNLCLHEETQHPPWWLDPPLNICINKFLLGISFISSL